MTKGLCASHLDSVVIQGEWEKRKDIKWKTCAVVCEKTYKETTLAATTKLQGQSNS